MALGRTSSTARAGRQTFPRCSLDVLCIALGNVRRDAEFVQWQLVLPGVYLQYGGDEGLRIEEARDPGDPWNNQICRPLGELALAVDEVHEPAPCRNDCPGRPMREMDGRAREAILDTERAPSGRADDHANSAQDRGNLLWYKQFTTSDRDADMMESPCGLRAPGGEV